MFKGIFLLGCYWYDMFFEDVRPDCNKNVLLVKRPYDMFLKKKEARPAFRSLTIHVVYLLEKLPLIGLCRFHHTVETIRVFYRLDIQSDVPYVHQS